MPEQARSRAPGGAAPSTQACAPPHASAATGTDITYGVLWPQEYKTTFEKMMMEEALAQLMQGSEAAELILPQPAVLTTSNQVRV